MSVSIPYLNLETGYRTLLTHLVEDGKTTSPRGQATYELENVVLEHNAGGDVLLHGVRPRYSQQLAALEALQLVGGFSDPKLLVSVVPHYASFLDGGKFHGAYGDRTGLKFGLIAERLKTDETTRRANVQFWDDGLDLAREGLHDYPCTMHMNFLMRNGYLNMTTVMRSNDAWLGFPYDLYQFTSVHRTMARFLGTVTGPYTHMVHSMHLYERDLDKAHELLNTKHTNRPAPMLLGGIGVGDEREWFHIQERAKKICYSPKDVTPRTLEEAWLIQQARKWQDKIGQS